MQPILSLDGIEQCFCPTKQASSRIINHLHNHTHSPSLRMEFSEWKMSV